MEVDHSQGVINSDQSRSTRGSGPIWKATNPMKDGASPFQGATSLARGVFVLDLLEVL